MSLHYGSEGSKQKGFSKLTAQDDRKNVFGLEQPVQLGDMFSVKRKTIDQNTPPELLQNDDVIVLAGRSRCRRSRIADVGQIGCTGPCAARADPDHARGEPRLSLLPAADRAASGHRRSAPPVAPRFPPGSSRNPHRIPLGELSHSEFRRRQRCCSDGEGRQKIGRGHADASCERVPRSAANDKIAPLVLPIADDKKTFVIRFAQNGRPFREWAAQAKNAEPVFPLIDKPATFDVTMKDTDNMTLTRTFTMNPVEDKPPTVNLYVDVIREVQANDRKVFMCTARPKSRLPKKVRFPTITGCTRSSLLTNICRSPIRRLSESGPNWLRGYGRAPRSCRISATICTAAKSCRGPCPRRKARRRSRERFHWIRSTMPRLATRRTSCSRWNNLRSG